MDTCRIEGCERPIKIKAQALCGLHYARWWKHGDPLAWKKRKRQTCSVENCDFKQIAHGLCSKHYTRQRRYGTTDRPERPTTCQIKGCNRSVNAWAMCDLHYRRERRGQNVARYCRFCGGVIDSAVSTARKFCSRECFEREQYIQRRERHRERWLKRYGMTVAGFDALMESQGGRCAICRTNEHNGRNWCVDHDHESGKVRGILCTDCNKLLGNANDDPAVLRSAIRYLSR